ncbi:MAG: hypothetical protein ABSD49_10980 [Candidatus Bathyarchaeia archaeon]
MTSRLGLSIVDRVWSMLQDGQWHTRHGILWTLHSREDEASLVLSFLVKYGFLEVSDQDRLRALALSPPPSCAARILRQNPIL